MSERLHHGNIENIQQYFEREASDFNGSYGNGEIKDWVRKLSYFYNQKPIRARLEAVQSLIPNPKGKKILEVGSGPGVYSISLAKLGALVTGIDYSSAMIKSADANARAAGVNVTFKRADFVKDSIDGNFDEIFAAGVIEYIAPENQVAFLAKMKSLSNGNVIVSFPKAKSIHRVIREIWLKLLKGIEICFFTNEGIKKLASEAGLKEVERRDAGVLWVVKFEALSSHAQKEK